MTKGARRGMLSVPAVVAEYYELYRKVLRFPHLSQRHARFLCTLGFFWRVSLSFYSCALFCTVIKIPIIIIAVINVRNKSNVNACFMQNNNFKLEKRAHEKRC